MVMKLKKDGRGRPKHLYSYPVEQGRKTHHKLVHSYLDIVDDLIKTRQKENLVYLIDYILKPRVDKYKELPNKTKEEYNKLEEWQTIIKYAYKGLYEIKHNNYLEEAIRMEDSIKFSEELDKVNKTVEMNNNGSYTVTVTNDIQAIYLCGMPLNHIVESGNARIEMSELTKRRRF